MRIGIEAQRVFRRKKHGMEVVTLELIRHLQEIDRDNEYVVFVKDDEDAVCIQESANFEIIKTPVFTYPYWEQWYLPKIAKKAKVDLLHCTSNTAPILYRSPLLLTLHDIIYLEKISFKGTSYQNFGNLYRRWVVPQVIHHCKQIITVSEFEKKRIIENLGLGNDQVKVVYNAISKHFRVIDDKNFLYGIAQKYRLPEQFILFFGNTAPKKNTAGVIEAYVHYYHHNQNPLPLVITDYAEEYVLQILEDLKVKDKKRILENLLILDHIPFEELPVVYNLSTLFLYPSLRESFGMPIIEAMACGIPVITSDTSSMPEVAGEAALLIDPLKPVEIAEGIQTVVSNKLLQKEMKEAGLSRAAKFRWENTAQEVLLTYKNCIA